MPSTAALPTASVRRRVPHRLRWTALGALLLLAAYAVIAILHWDDRALLWLKERFTSPAAQAQAVWLPGYRVTVDARPLAGMENDEASDLTYDPATHTLYAVMGKHPFLAQLTLQGDVLRKIPLEGWSNPEGVAMLGDGRLAITDERLHTLAVVSVQADTTALHYAEVPKVDLGMSANQNKGFEGVTWDARHQRLLLGLERPAKLFSMKLGDSGSFEADKAPVASDALDMRNLSAMTIDPRTGHMLLLSADSHMLMEADMQGEPVSFMALLGGVNGLKNTIPQAEGVAIDEQGTLYMVSEPNLFYAFKKQ
ncbi:SdiA-regulated domain-containing protein [Pseudomonas sp. RIT-PI-S]|uniref:SdiA-regulated domain-containing protein n=1 Tax=Pseudomonas sp. RIT-PI-S TaxID=3035295 RepID=UPI0021DAFC62|nr:SdiA-regulated domain-containing protein [Pseudomonas sp. RIT-PI-S]